MNEVGIRVNRRFLFGLFVYIQQIERSLDRALECPWPMVTEYFSTRTSPESVLRQMEQRGWQHAQTKTAPRSLSPWRAWRQRILNAFSKEPVLEPEQLAWIYEAFQRFSTYLSSNPVPSRMQRGVLRRDLAYCHSAIQRVLTDAERRACYEVEYFSGDTDRHGALLSEVVGGAWPED
jgi:hypothetical protein